MRKSLIYVCSPLGAPTKAEILTNAAKACSYMALAEKIYGVRAVAPHAYLPFLLDDTVPEERALAMDFGQKLLAMCSRVAVFGDRISKGMKAEIEMAERLGIPVDYQNLSLHGGQIEASPSDGSSMSA